jgi:ribosomal-protein-alanine N-acetyltransferase
MAIYAYYSTPLLVDNQLPLWPNSDKKPIRLFSSRARALLEAIDYSFPNINEMAGNVIEYQESFPNELLKLYQGKRCLISKVQLMVKNQDILTPDSIVIEKEEIDDIHYALLKEIEAGNLIFKNYFSLSKLEVKRIEIEVVYRILKNSWHRTRTLESSFYYAYFPQAMAMANQMDPKIAIGSEVIETERMILRAFRNDDLSDLFAYASNPEVGPHAGWPAHKNLDESKRILNLFINGDKTFAIVMRDTGKVVGSIGIEKRSIDLGQEFYRLASKEIGYVLAYEYWGRGLMPEAVKAVIKWCFENKGIDILTCGHFISNGQSQRVIEKCGFSYYKTIAYKTQNNSLETTRLYTLSKRAR